LVPVACSRFPKILQVRAAFFYEGAPGKHLTPDGVRKAVSPAYVTDFLATSEGLALITAFTRIKAPKLRRCIVHLVKQSTASSKN
jgi:hypothetical protein